MTRRYGRTYALQSLLFPALLYGTIASLILVWEWPYVKEVKHGVLITIGLFVVWRYGWMLLNYLRAFIYAAYYYPHLRKRIELLPENRRYPEHIFFLIPSYKEEPWVSMEAFRSIMNELATVPSRATLIVATSGDPAEEALIYETCRAHTAFQKTELVFQRQQEGKRIAMGHGLRAIARRFYKELPDKNSVTLMMDGDSYLEKGFLRKTLPHFAIDPELSAMTTNEIAYINSRSGWYRDWFGLKFGQRHILFQSHALSGKVLTLTGRLSLYRTANIVDEAFIRRLENDIITTPFHGKFRFLMGDDKSTWFHLLAQGSRMLYAPDALCYSLESRDADFWEISRSLSYRWYGNTLRNNIRALALGPRRIGSFYIWWAILDQRISMWTSLVGLAGSLTLAVFQSIHYLVFYIGWLTFVRLFQSGIITLGGHPVTWRTIPLMLYSQWVGAFVKIKALYHLNDQSWSKGGVEQTANDGFAPIRHPLFPYMPDAMMITSYILFVFIILVTHHALEIPDPSLLLADDYLSPEREKVVDAAAHGIVPNDGKDDATALQTLIDTLPSFSVLQLPAGTIDLYHPVTIRRDDLTIRGKGSNRTLFLSHIRGEGKAVLRIEGRRLAKTGMLQEDAHPGDGSVDIDFFKFPGTRWLLLRQPNDPAFLRRLGATRWHKRYPYLRQEILPVVRYEKKETVLANRLLTPFHKRSTEVFALAPVTGVTLRDFSMRQQIPGHRSQEVICRYQNLFPDYRVDLIRLKWAARCRIEHLHLQNAGRHPIDLDSCYGIQIGHIFIDGAWNKGKKGNGYLRLARTFHSILDHVTVRRIRHLTLQWSSAGNLLKALDLGADLNFHGGYSHDNTVTRVTFRIPPCHPWQKGITRTPSNAEWAPPDGPNNRVESIRFIKFR